ncbi:MAG: hypothetical protein E6337_09415 [Ligilactobacillus salivarius]|nr:hypothetical protein [Ligilactobacillus salivarius]
MNNISRHKADRFDKNFVTWMLVTQVVLVVICLYPLSVGFFITLPV